MKRLSGKRVLSMILAFLLTITTVFMGNVMEAKAEAGEIMITYEGEIADIELAGNHVQFSGGKVNGNISDGDNTLVIKTDPSRKITKVMINNTEIGLDSTNHKQLAEGGEQVTAIVTAAATYHLVVTTEASGYYSVVWAYDRNSFLGPDAFVENGKVEMISVDGQSVLSAFPGENLYYVKAGATVKVRLIPNHGYQVYAAKINDTTDLNPDNNEMSVFTFTMPSTNIHFSGKFEKSKTGDMVVNNATSIISNGAIGNGSVIAQSGDAYITLSNAVEDGSIPTGIQISAGNEVDSKLKVNSVDIATTQVVTKGNTGNNWTKDQHELSGNAEISLTVNQEANGYAVIRNHDGEYAEIPSTYDPATKKLIFGSDKFSTYILVPLTAPKNDYTPITTGNGSGNTHAAVKGNTGGAPHAHNFQWTSVMAPSNEQDGLEAYACTICGYYEESVPVSAYSYACTEAAKQVISAKQGAEITLKMGRWCAYPKWFMEKLAERRDLTIKLQFEYLHQQYEVMIPADTKIDTECDWYGPLKICSLYSYSVK